MDAFDKELTATSGCVECNVLKENEEVVKCQDCPFYFHPSCVDFLVSGYSKDSISNSSWCHNCFARTVARST